MLFKNQTTNMSCRSAADLTEAPCASERDLAMGGGRPAESRFTVGGSGKSVARCHRTVLAYWKFVDPDVRWEASLALVGLDRRPQLIDQCVAIVDLLPLLDPGQSVPQCQQPLAAERSRVQFLIRSNGNLALSHCGWRLAGQRDPVIADDVDAC